jgi:peptidoglycan hydrolase-like protein with peptidoglycan-binding domain
MLPKWFKRTLVDGELGPDVQVVARKLGGASGAYDSELRARVRGFQAATGLDADGITGPLTAAALGESADAHLPPEWFTRTLSLGMEGEDVEALRFSLSIAPAQTFDAETRRAVLRWQSANHLPLTGEVDQDMALLLA